jgi:hypothetical protein
MCAALILLDCAGFLFFVSCGTGGAVFFLGGCGRGVLESIVFGGFGGNGLSKFNDDLDAVLLDERFFETFLSYLTISRSLTDVSVTDPVLLLPLD